VAKSEVGLVRVLLSASIPDPIREPRFHLTADNIAIRECVVAVAEVVLQHDGTLIFGGHPAISPLIARVAGYLGKLDRVTVHQSRLFAGASSSATHVIPDIRWSEVVAGRHNESLRKMRQEMVDPMHGAEGLQSAFFVGGMEGIEEEYTLLRSAQPLTAFWPIPTTGAAAAERYRQNRDEILSQPAARLVPWSATMLATELETARTYRDLVRLLLNLP
jgi:SLOG-like protein